ncbi:MAG: hypothetical protein JHC93_02810 [Parachlamydiales bacterium]|nr:hypothetical protein [Parachlamydiales bacterium]
MIGKIFQRKATVTQKEKNQLAHSIAAKQANETHAKAKARLMKDHFDFYIKSWRNDLLSLLEGALNSDEKKIVVHGTQDELLAFVNKRLETKDSTYVMNKLNEIHSELRLLVEMQQEVQSPNSIAFHYHLACLHEEVECMMTNMLEFCQKFTVTIEEAIESSFQEYIQGKMKSSDASQTIMQKASVVKEALLHEDELEKMVSFVYNTVGPLVCDELKTFTNISKKAAEFNPSMNQLTEEQRVVPKIFNAQQYTDMASRIENFSNSFQKENLKSRLKSRLQDLVDV